MTPAIALVCLLLSAGISSPGEPDGRILVFTRTTGFRHDAIPDGVAAVRRIAGESGMTVDATEDPGAFTDANLARYRLIVFLLTTGDVLDGGEQAALERRLRNGGGWVGVHSASDTEYDWPFYGDLVGAYFAGHPAVQPAIVHVEDRRHPATAALPPAWRRTDEWYDFRVNPRSAVHVLATLDETTYDGGSMGADHPIAWCRESSGVRAFYTAGGHTRESYTEPLFVAHLAGGIRWAAGLEPGSCGPDLRGAPLRVAPRRPTPRVVTPRP
jgi:type 1 glutamine amidotransferase